MKTTQIDRETQKTKFLCQVRESLGITPDQQALMLGVKYSTLYRWEKGITKTPMLTIGQFKNLVKQVKKAGMNIKDIPENFN